MTDDDHATGQRQAAEFLDLLSAGDGTAAAALLAGLPHVRELVFLGAGLTAIARAEGRTLPPAQRAQASTRQDKLGQLRNSHREDVEGLRSWLVSSAEEILFLRSLRRA